MGLVHRLEAIVLVLVARHTANVMAPVLSMRSGCAQRRKYLLKIVHALVAGTSFIRVWYFLCGLQQGRSGRVVQLKRASNTDSFCAVVRWRLAT